MLGDTATHEVPAIEYTVLSLQVPSIAHIRNYLILINHVATSAGDSPSRQQPKISYEELFTLCIVLHVFFITCTRTTYFTLLAQLYMTFVPATAAAPCARD
jgi:hypothetical protein